MMADIVAPGLRVLFVGYNPGRKSEASGHHFAGPGNLFWQLLADTGFTPRRLAAEEDQQLLLWGLGITNLVDRMTPGSADLSVAEKRAGAVALRAKIQQYRPRAACFLGKDIYRAYAGTKASAAIAWGLQSPAQVPAVIDFVAPNPSRRSTLPMSLRLSVMTQLRGIVQDEGT